MFSKCHWSERAALNQMKEWAFGHDQPAGVPPPFTRRGMWPALLCGMSNRIGLVDSKGFCRDTADASHGSRNAPGIRQRLVERCAFVALMIVALVVVACAFSAMMVARQE